MSVKHEWRFKNSDPPIIDALMRLASTIEATGGVADEEDGDGVAADPDWLDLRDAYERAVEALDAPDLAVYRAAPKLLEACRNALLLIHKYAPETGPQIHIPGTAATKDELRSAIIEATGGVR